MLLSEGGTGKKTGLKIKFHYDNFVSPFLHWEFLLPIIFVLGFTQVCCCGQNIHGIRLQTIISFDHWAKSQRLGGLLYFLTTQSMPEFCCSEE